MIYLKGKDGHLFLGKFYKELILFLQYFLLFSYIFEAESKIDNGAIYDKVFISLDGSELIDNIRQKLFKAIKKLVINFVIRYPNNKGIDQLGDSTFYRKRNENDRKNN